jgi:hypothetical protein
VATTHEFPTDRVHFTWGVDNEPVITIKSSDMAVYETRDVATTRSRRTRPPRPSRRQRFRAGAYAIR